MLRLENINKSYGEKHVLKGFSANLDYGIYGLLGKNGAGKTTLINIITGLISADSGTLYYDDKNVKKLGNEYIGKIGYMPQYVQFYKNYTVEEFLRYMCAIKGIKRKEGKIRIANLLKEVNLSDEAKTKIGALSGGMRQRVGIAQALINNPKILILDEPTAGLDPEERIRFRNLITNVSNERIVILATHIVQDIEHIANRIIMISDGKVAFDDKPQNVVSKYDGKVGVGCIEKKDLELVKNKYSVSNLYLENNKYYVRIVEEKLPAGFTKVNADLEDVFMYVENGGIIHD